MNKAEILKKLDYEGIQLSINFNKLKRELCQESSPCQPDKTIKYCKDMFKWREGMIIYYNKFNLT